ncbi:hypothetical protein C488_18008 [Natrinema pellirubrum DSM 15624]|uniref:UPF0201 protein Natpe_3713 n=1 Tax=Natrinema pellirubrum (strain DSM 15624 / CIP 106293 / JCM 10476 / NCIMB 786 / 157) TaxID=797303 RepID=L0JPM5_NATP1|nr:RNA-binding domain-containing protein [Natrinema pellirubrum]AGB33475.1 hypothetical protein Natpe_3713 [Natrinema pellirubrum DSM 15624]ELY71164.1 hypothetical protein C488_18008 [Natrinema pellirubrum DSM 15624]
MSEIYRVDVEITAPIYDTEVTGRVVDAVANIFPNADVEEEFGEVRGEAHALDHFSDLLHQQEILDTARGEFFANRDGETFTFALKKQAAFEGHANFSVGDSDELGEISVRVRVEAPSLEEYVDHIAPPTEDGRPVDA